MANVASEFQKHLSIHLSSDAKSSVLLTFIFDLGQEMTASYKSIRKESVKSMKGRGSLGIQSANKRAIRMSLIAALTSVATLAMADGRGGAGAAVGGSTGVNGGPGGGGGSTGLGGETRSAVAPGGNGTPIRGGAGSAGRTQGGGFPGVGGAGGLHGTFANPVGSAGGPGGVAVCVTCTNGLGGGGGGGGGDGFIGGSLDGVAAPVVGGNGGVGGSPLGPGFPRGADGGSGGGGGAGAILTGSGTTSTTFNVSGGRGGNGGSAVGIGATGWGGGGGSGVVASGVNLVNAQTVTGGNGGDSPVAPTEGGSRRAGMGGHGVVGNSVSISNTGVIRGGNAGTENSAVFPRPRIGGSGVTGTSLNVVNAGEISGGLNTLGERGLAIDFVSGDNTLELQRGWIINGRVRAASSGQQTLILGGTGTDLASVSSGEESSTIFNVQNIGDKFTNFSSFRKDGASEWRLVGASTATTPWQITQGVLEVEQDASLGSTGAALSLNGGTLRLTGNIATARAISIGNGGGGIDVVDGNSVVLAGQVHGSGELTKTGMGTLDLRLADVQHAGGTRLAAGTTIGHAESFGAGPLVNNSTLVLSQTSDGEIRNAVSGTGRVLKEGGGTLTVGSSWTLSGQLEIDQGTVRVDQNLAAVAVEVNNEGALLGSGTVGATTVRAGGRIAPLSGASAPLRINGSLRQETGSQLLVTLGAQDQPSNRVVVDGSVQIDSGAELNIALSSGTPFQLGGTYRVLEATGPINGGFDFVTSMGSPFIQYTQRYALNTLDVEVVQATPFISAARTRNQTALATSLDGLAPSDPLRSSLAMSSSLAEFEASLNTLTGDIYPSLQSAQIQESGILRRLIGERARFRNCVESSGAPSEQVGTGAHGLEADAGGHCDERQVWGEYLNSSGKQRGDGNASGWRRTSSAVAFGMDTRERDRWSFGMATAMGAGQVSLSNQPSTSKDQNFSIGGYAQYRMDAWRLYMGAASTWHEARTRRDTWINASSGRVSSKQRSRTDQLFVELQMTAVQQEKVSINPYVGLAHVRNHAHAFAEQARVGALRSDDSSVYATYSSLGLRVNMKSSEQSQFSLDIGAQKKHGTQVTSRMMGFVQAPEVAAYTVDAARSKEYAFTIDGTYRVHLGKRSSLLMAYGGNLDDSPNMYSLRVAFEMGF